MSTPNSTALMQKLIAVFTLAVAFLVMASLFVPGDSSAADGQHDHEDHAASHADAASHAANANDHPADTHGEAWVSEDPHADLACLGTIESVNYEVQIYQTDRGVRFSVVERATGALRATLISPQQVEELFPELPIPSMNLDDQTLMLATPPSYDLHH